MSKLRGQVRRVVWKTFWIATLVSILGARIDDNMLFAVGFALSAASAVILPYMYAERIA